MDAKKCDRCGKFYEPYTIKDNRFPFEVNGIAFARIYQSGESRAFDSNSHDLCKNCFESMHAFFKNPERFAEKKHGRWDDSADGITPYCTVCEKTHRCFNRTPNFCPNCGACMDAGEDQSGGGENATD